MVVHVELPLTLRDTIMSCIKQMLNAGLRVTKSQALTHFNESELLIQTYEHVRYGFGQYATLKVANERNYAKYLASFN